MLASCTNDRAPTQLQANEQEAFPNEGKKVSLNTSTDIANLFNATRYDTYS